MNISFKEPYYNFIKSENIKSIELYYKFLNWIQGEFDLYQIDESEGLKVYCPNGFFTIRILNKNNEITSFEISVKNKSKKSGNKIYQKLESLYNHLIDISKMAL